MLMSVSVGNKYKIYKYVPETGNQLKFHFLKSKYQFKPVGDNIRFIFDNRQSQIKN